MKTVNVGLIGFGTVGKGVVKTLLQKKKVLRERTGVSINLVRVVDKDLRARKGVPVNRKLLSRDIDSVVKNKSIDIVVELIGGMHPAKEIILRSLTLGKHVVTANKALLAEHGREIFTAASRFGSHLGFEASVGGGIPVINPLRRTLIANNIERIYGILNGTSNFILSKMSNEGLSFREALRIAQSKGIAEKNPNLDINGADSAHKLVILALLGFGKAVNLKEIYTEGITAIEPQDLEHAGKWGYTAKLLGIAKKAGRELDIRVHPTLISSNSVLASVKYEDNAILIKGDMVGEALFYGKGAGTFPTASSVISDIVDIAKDLGMHAEGNLKKGRVFSRVEFGSGIGKVRRINDLSSRSYLRFSAIDRPGVLAGISGILSQNKISIATVIQKERKKGQPVPIVMLTHDANEGRMKKALARIDGLPFITRKTVRLRIEQ